MGTPSSRASPDSLSPAGVMTEVGTQDCTGVPGQWEEPPRAGIHEKGGEPVGVRQEEGAVVMGTYTDQSDRGLPLLSGESAAHLKRLFVPARIAEGPKMNSITQDMEVREEGQEKELPRPKAEDEHSAEDDEDESPTAGGDRPAPPTSLELSENPPRKKRLVAPAISLTLQRSDSVFSDDFATAALSPSPDDDDPQLDINLEDMETPSDSESFDYPEGFSSPNWEGDVLRMGRSRVSVTDQAEIGNLELDKVDNEGRRWRRFVISGQECHVNMSVLEPYLRVLSHGGYYGEGLNAIIVFSSCYLPENTIENYQYVMDNLFRYIVGTLELMVSENYVIVYLCGMAPRSKMPNIKWLRQCYMTIDRSAKFSRKVRFIRDLQELSEFIPMDHVQIPDCIREFDENMKE
ncbi:hypothetical protein JZ751_007241 [Albula glossodonta]|uniref:CRAL-TRIO domain-containing protein n=1 Tax=Albula glossodonta TaxID=121402 RepID=A0A8T2N457_9TELE|nr:hypothetical protein JZ751_007241 [Albula glossodonta]